MREHSYYRTRHRLLCPIVFHIPGLLNVMKRAKELTDTEYTVFKRTKRYKKLTDEFIVAITEDKSDSWGWLDGKVVAIDYGD